MTLQRRITGRMLVILLSLSVLFSLAPGPSYAQAPNDIDTQVEQAIAAKQKMKDELNAKLAAMIAEKTKLDEANVQLRPKLKELYNNIKGMEGTTKDLNKFYEKLDAVRFWNAFVASISVTNDIITKVNVSSSIVLTGIGILQDRLMGELPGGPDSFKLKVKSFDEATVKMSGKMQELLNMRSMSNLDVAKRMLADGSIQLDAKPLIRCPFTNPKYTVELLATSPAIVTGRNRYVQEAIAPAIAELKNMITILEDVEQPLLMLLESNELTSAQLTREINALKSQLELQNALDDANKVYKAPPPNTLDPYRNNSPALDYSDAIAAADAAWQELEGCQIDGETYLAKLTLARNGACIKVNTVLAPYQKRCEDARAAAAAENQAHQGLYEPITQLLAQEDKDPNNWYWNPYVGMVRKNTEGVKRFWQWIADRNALNNRWFAEISRLGLELQEADTKEWDACRKALDTIERQKNERYKMEGEALVVYLNKLKLWEESPIDIAFTNWSSYAQTVETKSYQLSRVGRTGENLASSVTFASTRQIQSLLQSMALPWGWSIVGAKNRFDTWLTGVRKSATTIDEVVAFVKSSENAAAGLASECPSLASMLEPKIEVWRYVRGYPSGSGAAQDLPYLDTREDFPRLRAYQEAYLASVEAYMPVISELDKSCELIIDNATKIAAIMAQEQPVVDVAQKTLEGLQRTHDGMRTNLDTDGTAQLSTLAMNGISEEVIQDLESLIADFASPEKLHAHVLMLIPGEEDYNPAIKPILPKEVIEALRKSAKSRMAAVAANRDAYATAYQDYTTVSATLNTSLESMQRELQDIAPALSSKLDRATVLRDVKENFMKDNPSFQYFDYLNYYPANPEDFADPDYGVMARLDKYEQLAEKYHSFIDPELQKIARSHSRETRMLNEMADMIDREGPAWMALGGSAFSEKWNALSNDAYSIISPISISGEAERGSPVRTAYNRVMTSLCNFSSKYYAAETLKALIAELSSVTGGVTHFLVNPETSGGVATAREWMTVLQKYADPTSSAMQMKSTDVTLAALLDEVKRQIPQLQKIVDADTNKQQEAITAEIKAFYDQFKRAYEAKNDSKVMSYISDKWKSNDGTTIDDLQEHLQQSFKVFDEIRYTLSGLKVEQLAPGKYKASYDLVITGRIFRNDIKHEEKSSVSEELAVNDKGKLLIMRNLDGRFWSVE